MDSTPERPAAVRFDILPDADNTRSPRRSCRVKKNPSITPNRFNRFFNNPRLQAIKNTSVRTSRKALRHLTAAKLNARSTSTQSGDGQPLTKKRKLSFTSVTSVPSSPICGHGDISSSQGSIQATTRLAPVTVDEIEDATLTSDDEVVIDFDEVDSEDDLPSRPRVSRYQTISTSARQLSGQLGRRRLDQYSSDSNLWQYETGNFYSLPEDVFVNSKTAQRQRALPFCATSLNTQEMVAIGNEDGQVEIFRCWPRMENYDESLKFEARMLPHDNAIMDMEFSPDDRFLATASGDQTCRIIDMNTRTGTHTLVGHVGSLKRVQWQPGSNNNILVTCSRDGSICLWDLRCANKEAGSLKVKPLIRAPHFLSNSHEVAPKTQILDAHNSWDKAKLVNGKKQAQNLSSRYDYAVTTCSFISESRPHMLATASEHNAIIKLWDMRASYKSKCTYVRPIPVSATLEPASHESNRPFGVTSIAMSTDSSRLYSLCRDNTIYTYSTSHLILGSNPEMSLNAPDKPFKQARGAGAGLGPLYGFRHPCLKLGSFYDKLSLRPKTDEHVELLAAGTGEDCAILFPTDEKYLNASLARPAPNITSRCPTTTTRSSAARPSLPQRTNSSLHLPSTTVSTSSVSDDPRQCPIFNHGTPLLNAHRKEVTAVAWIPTNGQLVTVADDYTARCWYEDDPGKARELRGGKGKGWDGGRDRSGWAGLRDGFDRDDGEEC
jgi:WD40 repeat protein